MAKQLLTFGSRRFVRWCGTGLLGAAPFVPVQCIAVEGSFCCAIAVRCVSHIGSVVRNGHLHQPPKAFGQQHVQKVEWNLQHQRASRPGIFFNVLKVIHFLGASTAVAAHFIAVPDGLLYSLLHVHLLHTSLAEEVFCL
jgi:hypothetical protein